MKQKSSLMTRLVGAPYIVWAALFIIVPLCMVAYYAFTDNSGAFTLANISSMVKYTDTFILSIWLGLLATVICLIIAYPLAYCISKTSEKTVSEASMMYMLELKNMFPDVSTDSFEYTERELNGKVMFATHLMYQGQYYLCGVMESGNTLIKFVYSASAMTGEIADIDEIIGSINYRDGGKIRE